MSQFVCTHRRKIKIPFIGVFGKMFFEAEVDCGKCHYCMTKRKNQWATRLAAQFMQSPKNSCLWCLFTYDNDHVPAFNELGKKRFSAFIKRYRRWLEYHFSHKGMKFFCSGEYGTKNHRPHFHVIFFNLPVCTSYPLQVCPALKYQMELLWKQGFVKVKRLESVEQIYYCAKYAAKGLSEHEDVKPCILYSKGLGRDYVKSLVGAYWDSKKPLFNQPLIFNIGRFVFYPASVKSYRNWIYTDKEKKSMFLHYLLSRLEMTDEEKEEYRQKYIYTQYVEEQVAKGDTWQHFERRFKI